MKKIPEPCGAGISKSLTKQENNTAGGNTTNSQPISVYRILRLVSTSNPKFSRNSERSEYDTMIFEHLIEPDFTPVHQAPPHDIVDAQMSTLDFMTATLPGEAPRTPDYDSLRATPSEAALAQKAFTSLLNGDTSANKNLVNLKTPTAVRHHVAMLSAYDWDFVEEAKKLRGFVVAKLLDEVNHPDARIRLRALQLVGTLTEVASFTERSEVIHKDHTADELVTRLRSKLTGLLPKVVEIETVEVKATEDNE